MSKKSWRTLLHGSLALLFILGQLAVGSQVGRAEGIEGSTPTVENTATTQIDTPDTTQTDGSDPATSPDSGTVTDSVYGQDGNDTGDTEGTEGTEGHKGGKGGMGGESGAGEEGEEGGGSGGGHSGSGGEEEEGGPPEKLVYLDEALSEVSLVEGADTYHIKIARTWAGAVEVRWEASGTATAGEDFRTKPVSGKLSFKGNSQPNALVLDIDALDDILYEGDESVTFTFSLGQAEGGWQWTGSNSFTVNIIDNDSPPELLVTPAEQALREGGAAVSYTIALATEPTEDVTVTLTPDDKLTVDPTALTFTPANWSEGQTVNVTAVDDTAIEGTHYGVIRHTVAGGNYDGIAAPDFKGRITDNDRRPSSNSDSYTPPPAPPQDPTPPAGGDASGGTSGGTEELYFTDIAGHWAEPRIMGTAKKGVVSGYSDHTFRPNVAISREDFAKGLILAMGLEPVTAPALTFTDATQFSQGMEGYIAAAVNAGLMTAQADNRFAPQEGLTRSDAIIILVKALRLKLTNLVTLTNTTFADDSAIPNAARQDVATAERAAIVEGFEDHTFRGSDFLTRSQAAKLFEAVTGLLAEGN